MYAHYLINHLIITGINLAQEGAGEIALLGKCLPLSQA